MFIQLIAGIKHLSTRCTSVHETVWEVGTLQVAFHIQFPGHTIPVTMDIEYVDIVRDSRTL